jgi:hypothetical protein
MQKNTREQILKEISRLLSTRKTQSASVPLHRLAKSEDAKVAYEDLHHDYKVMQRVMELEDQLFRKNL